MAEKSIVFWSGTWLKFPSPSNNFFIRPTASYVLSHWLRKFGFKCQVIEFIQHMSTEELVAFTEPLIDKNTLAIAMSTTMWPHVANSMPSNITEALKILKDKYPTLKVIIGGSGAKYYANPLINKIFSGEGEDHLLAWCQDQVSFRKINPRFDIKSCDHIFDVSDCIQPNEMLPLELGRGCVFKCAFCSYDNIGKPKGSYLRDPKLLRESIVRNKYVFGTTNYMFTDDTCNEDPDKMLNIAAINADVHDMKWIGFLRADLIWSHKNSSVLMDSGLTQAYFGLESFHPQASMSIGKGWSGKQAKDWIPQLYNSLWNKKIGMEGSFIVGLPYEDMQSLEDTYKWINENQYFRGYFAGLHLDPGSKFDLESDKFGYTTNNGIWHNQNCPDGIDGSNVNDIAQAFNDRLKPNWKLRGFYAASFYSLGYTQQEIEDANWTDGEKLAQARKESFMNTYKGMLKSVILGG